MAHQSPIRFDKQRQDRFLGALRKGLRIGEAAKAAGITRQQVYNYRQSHPEFDAAAKQAEADYCDEVEKLLLEAARKLNMTAIVFYLTNRAPDRWQDRRAYGVRPTPEPAPATPNVDDLKAKLNALLPKEDNA